MNQKKSFAPKLVDLIIGDSRHDEESRTIPSDSHLQVCDRLLKNPQLKGWEKLFIRTLATSPKAGRRQIEKLRAIAARLNDGGEG